MISTRILDSVFSKTLSASGYPRTDCLSEHQEQAPTEGCTHDLDLYLADRSTMQNRVVDFSLESDRLDSEVIVDLDGVSRIEENHNELESAGDHIDMTYKATRFLKSGDQSFEHGQSLIVSTPSRNGSLSLTLSTSQRLSSSTFGGTSDIYPIRPAGLLRAYTLTRRNLPIFSGLM